MPAMVQGGAQAQHYGGSTAAPDIRVIRASGASSNTNASVAPGRMPYDPPSPVSSGVPPASSSSSRSPPTSPTRRGPTRSPPQGMYSPGRPSMDSSESGPQWTPGVGREDDAEAAVPLTAGLKSSHSTPANMYSSSPSPSYPPHQQQQQQQPPKIMTSSTSHPTMMRSNDAPASPYDNMALYNPYDRQQQQQQQQQPAGGRHRWEETDATAASYHTAEGTMGSPQYKAATRGQLPAPGSESRQQQTPSPPGGFGGAYYPPQQYGGGGSQYAR